MPNGGLHSDYGYNSQPTIEELIAELKKDRDGYKQLWEEEKAKADKFQKMYGTLRNAMNILKDKA